MKAVATYFLEVGHGLIELLWSVSRNVRVRCTCAPGQCVPGVRLRRVTDRPCGGRVVLCQCESGSVASLDACDGRLSVGKLMDVRKSRCSVHCSDWVSCLQEWRPLGSDQRVVRDVVTDRLEPEGSPFAQASADHRV